MDSREGAPEDMVEVGVVPLVEDCTIIINTTASASRNSTTATVWPLPTRHTSR